jgi:hypothetical protein
MKRASQLFLYVFLIVISDPYKGLDYNKVNVYDVNYCSGQCYNQSNDEYEYDEEEDEEEWEDDIKDEYEKDDKPLIFPVDFWKKDN